MRTRSYKTVEWLPGQLQEQREDGMFELVELAPALLLGQSGQRSMWAEVRELMSRAEREAFEEAGGEGDPLEIVDLPATRYAPSAAAADALVAASNQLPVPTKSLLQPPNEQPATSSDDAIEAVVDYRIFKGLEQWRVRWRGYGPDSDTWERMQVLESHHLTGDAEAERRRVKEI